MHTKWLSPPLSLGLIALTGSLGLIAAGCADHGPAKPVEILDEHTGMTLAVLKEPIELVQSSTNASLASGVGRRPTFAYAGPVEWDRMGTFGYALWVHIAPGNDRPVSDPRAPGAVTLILDDGPLVLSPIQTPALGRDAYPAVVSWGQTVYFELTTDMLKQMAASQKFELDVRAADDSIMSFIPSHDTRATLTEYARERGITGD